MIVIKEINTCENMAELKLPVEIITKREEDLIHHNHLGSGQFEHALLEGHDFNNHLINLSYDCKDELGPRQKEKMNHMKRESDKEFVDYRDSSRNHFYTNQPILDNYQVMLEYGKQVQSKLKIEKQRDYIKKNYRYHLKNSHPK